MLEIDNSLVQDLALAETVGFLKDLPRLTLDQFVDESDEHLAEAVGSSLPEQGGRMVHHIVDNSVNHIGRIVDGRRDTGLDPPTAVAADVDQKTATLHPLQILPIDDMVFPGGIPKNGVNDHIILGNSDRNKCSVLRSYMVVSAPI